MSDELIPKEYELFYKDKSRKEDIIAYTMGLPFQKVKQFGSTKTEWENKLILGDNLQVTKYLLKLKKEGKLRNKDGSDGFKLICIDPPFATKQEFRDSSGTQVYSDKINGSEYIEFIRQRLIILHELLTDDGSIYIEIDWHEGHYVKIIMDELFGKGNFINEIVWKRTFAHGDVGQGAKHLGRLHDIILVYTKTENYTFNQIYTPYEQKYEEEHFRHIEKDGRRFQSVSLTAPGGAGKGNPYYEFLGIKRYWQYSKENMQKLLDENKIHHTKPGNVPRRKMFLDESSGVPLQDIWIDIPPVQGQANENVNYVTQKPEALIKRIIEISSNEGDLILDSFCGSGTTLAVAEKQNRRWIGIDSSKFAIYTCLKRILNLKKEIGNAGKPLKPEPFGVYNAGLYLDGDNLKNLDDEEYKKFALELFQVESADLELGGFKIEGMLMNSHVHIFPRDGSLTEDYITDLDRQVGGLIKERMFIIVPANRVFFLQDYVEMNGRRYYALRIPYSVIDELHNQRFRRPLQPKSVNELNQTIDSVGFDFIRPPEVDAEYSHINSTGKLIEELEIKIKKFNSVQLGKNPIPFEDKESLSMVLIDRFYNDSFFNLTDSFFADTIKKEDWKIQFPYDAKMKKIMIIYLDVLGNERIEIKKITQFKRES